MSEHIGLARRLALEFAFSAKRYPEPHDDCMSLGDVGRRLGIPIGTALGERLREARIEFGYRIPYCDQCFKFSGDHRYHLDRRQVSRVIRECSLPSVKFRQMRRVA